MVTILEVVTPILVAVVTTVGAVLIAKVTKMQRDMKTNHGSLNLGDAVDRIWSKVDKISDNQDGLIKTVDYMEDRLNENNERITEIEKSSIAVTEVVTGRVKVIPPIIGTTVEKIRKKKEK